MGNKQRGDKSWKPRKPGTTFVKEWNLRNIGTEPWTGPDIIKIHLLKVFQVLRKGTRQEEKIAITTNKAGFGAKGKPLICQPGKIIKVQAALTIPHPAGTY